MKHVTIFLALFLLALAVACGGGESAVTPQDDTIVNTDVETPPTDTLVDPDGITDLMGDLLQDVTFLDLMEDVTPPTVASSNPAANAMNVPLATPFVVSVTFSEDIRKETVDTTTFKMKDSLGNAIPGDLAYNAATFTVTFTVKTAYKMQYASPYTVTLDNKIADKAGNRMEWYQFKFYTAAPAALTEFDALAAKYAPVIYQAVSPTAPQFDYLAAFEFDGDWKASNNDANIKTATSITPYVYYDVVETKSHYFVRYAFFWPRHGGVSTDDAFANDLAGSMVVVQKHPEEHPISVQNYFFNGNREIQGFVTNESGLSYRATEKYDQAVLFKGNRWEAYLTAGAHENCLWIRDNTQSNTPCQKSGNPSHYIQYVYEGGTAEPIAKATTFPNNLTEVGYGLKSILGEWWTRRDAVDANGIWASTVSYAPLASCGDCLGAGQIVPQSFQNPVSPTTAWKGFAPWGWEWLTGIGQFFESPAGFFFIDPAHFFATRHSITVNEDVDDVDVDYYSVQYCFNPYLSVDRRDEPGCGDNPLVADAVAE